MFKKLNRFLHTLYRLKPSQIFYQILNRLNLLSLFQKKFKVDNISSSDIIDWNFLSPITKFYPSKNLLIFLNKKYEFKDEVDWNYSEYGKLWTYNLNYLDFINQDNLNHNKINDLLRNYLSRYKKLKDGIDPYPTSIRIINLSKLISSFPQTDSSAYKILTRDIRRLSSNLEKHLLGNHLLENLLALWVGNHFIKNKNLAVFLNKKLVYELDEQILKDGAHYELSPMYHQIILGRLLECISLAKNNPNEWNQTMLSVFINKSEVMLSWLKNISFNFTHFIRINDSVEGIAPNYKDLLKLSKKLDFHIKPISLGDSNIRKLSKGNLSMLIDLSNISPSYQPGHSHSDALNFLLFYRNTPIIVDPAISTYEKNKSRDRERSSCYHNIVVRNNENHDEIWSSFRVGRSSKTKILKENKNNFKAIKKGYDKNISHQREWAAKENGISIIDVIANTKEDHDLYLHFHPNLFIDMENDKLIIDNKIEIQFQYHKKIEIVDYFYAKGFNNTVNAKRAKIQFKQHLVTSINKK